MPAPSDVAARGVCRTRRGADTAGGGVLTPPAAVGGARVGAGGAGGKLQAHVNRTLTVVRPARLGTGTTVGRTARIPTGASLHVRAPTCEQSGRRDLDGQRLPSPSGPRLLPLARRSPLSHLALLPARLPGLTARGAVRGALLASDQRGACHLRVRTRWRGQDGQAHRGQHHERPPHRVGPCEPWTSPAGGTRGGERAPVERRRRQPHARQRSANLLPGCSRQMPRRRRLECQPRMPLSASQSRRQEIRPAARSRSSSRLSVAEQASKLTGGVWKRQLTALYHFENGRIAMGGELRLQAKSTGRRAATMPEGRSEREWVRQRAPMPSTVRPPARFLSGCSTRFGVSLVRPATRW